MSLLAHQQKRSNYQREKLLACKSAASQQRFPQKAFMEFTSKILQLTLTEDWTVRYIDHKQEATKKRIRMSDTL